MYTNNYIVYTISAFLIQICKVSHTVLVIQTNCTLTSHTLGSLPIELRQAFTGTVIHQYRTCIHTRQQCCPRSKKGNTCKLPVLFSWAIQVISGLLRIHLFRFSELQNLLTVKKLVWSKTCLRPKQLVRDTRLGVQWLYKLYAFTYFVYSLLGLTR